jgi:hypothetical protein
VPVGRSPLCCTALACHTLLIAADDGKSSGLNLLTIAERQSLVEIGISLMPFCSINGPTHRSGDSLWLLAGDHEAWAIRIKAAGGLLMNGIALVIAIAMIKLAILNIEQRDHI